MLTPPTMSAPVPFPEATTDSIKPLRTCYVVRAADFASHAVDDLDVAESERVVNYHINHSQPPAFHWSP